MRQQISSGIDVAVSNYGFAATHLHVLRNELLKEVFTMLLLLLVVLAAVWFFSWGGPRFYPAYADRYRAYPLWGGGSHVLLAILAILLILWLLGVIRL